MLVVVKVLHCTHSSVQGDWKSHVGVVQERVSKLILQMRNIH